MTYIVGIIGAALLFGVFALLRPREAGCTGQCVGCAGDGACERRAGAPHDGAGSFE